MNKAVLPIILGIAVLLSANNFSKKHQDMQNWLVTNGNVISSSASNEYRSGHRYLLVTVQYEYQVEGQRYTAAEWIVLRGQDAQVGADEYSARKEVAVYYNPLNPGEAALESKKSGNGLSLYILGGFLVLMGVVAVIRQ